jgi:hypothetical protein
MSVDKYFEVRRGDLREFNEGNVPHYKKILSNVKMRELSLPALQLNYAIPVSNSNRIARFAQLPSYTYKGQDVSMSSYNCFSFYNQMNNSSKTIQVEHCTSNLDVSSMKIIQSRNNTPEYSSITLSLKKNLLSLSSNDEYRTTAFITFLHNCIHMQAKFGNDGNLVDAKAEFSLRHASLSSILPSIKNPYDGLFFNTREKLAKSNLLERELVILDSDAINFILAQELGIYSNTKINYEKTIDNLIKRDDSSNWEKLLVFDCEK